MPINIELLLIIGLVLYAHTFLQMHGFRAPYVRIEIIHGCRGYYENNTIYIGDYRNFDELVQIVFHEYFHAVQDQYYNLNKCSIEDMWWTEGMATAFQLIYAEKLYPSIQTALLLNYRYNISMYNRWSDAAYIWLYIKDKVGYIFWKEFLEKISTTSPRNTFEELLLKYSINIDNVKPP